jgi:hypothetical protein
MNMKFVYAAVLAVASAMSAEAVPICKFPDYTPAFPRPGSLTAYESRIYGPSDREAKRDKIFEINGGGQPLPFRIAAYNESLPVRVLYKKQDNTYEEGPLIFPGTSADIDKGNVYLKYFCGLDSSTYCTSKPPAAKLLTVPTDQIALPGLTG